MRYRFVKSDVLLMDVDTVTLDVPYGTCAYYEYTLHAVAAHLPL